MDPSLKNSPMSMVVSQAALRLYYSTIRSDVESVSKKCPQEVEKIHDCRDGTSAGSTSVCIQMSSPKSGDNLVDK